MKQYKNLTYNTFFIFLGNMGTKLLGFILLPFYTKYLTPEIYGELNLITAFVNFMTPILTLELSGAIFRLASGKSEKEQNSFIITGIVYTIPIILLSFFVLKLLVNFFGLAYIQKYYYILLVTFVFNFISGMIKEKIRCNSEIKLYSLIGILETLLIIILNIYLVPKMLLLGMLLSSLISSVLMTGYLLFKINIFRKITIKNLDKTKYKEMLNYSLPLVPNAVVWWIMGLSDRFFINYYHNMELVGIYSIAVKYPLLITTLFGIFYKALQISALEEYKNQNYSEFFNNMFNLISDILLFSTIFLTFFIKLIMKISVSELYYSCWVYIPLLLLATVFNSYSGILGVNYLVNKNSKAVFKSSVIATVVNIMFNFVLIPKYSIFGAIIATLLAYLVLFYIRIRESKKMVKIKINFKFIVSNFIPIIMLIVLIKSNHSYFYNFMIGILFLVLNKKRFLGYIQVIISRIC